MLKLYHAASAVCAAKVRLVLAEKGLTFESQLLDLASGDQFKPEYIKLNPNAVVPTLIHDGNIIIESTVINEYIDDAFPDTPLRPADAVGRARVHLWTKKEDSIHDAINTMTATIIFRHDLMQKTPEERAKRYAKIPDPARRQKWQRMIDEGLSSSIVQEALVRFARHFADMDKALAKTSWLAGDTFTLADAGLLSFFYRLEILHCSGLWQDRFPHVTAWYERSKQRASFRDGIAGYVPQDTIDKYTHVAQPQWPKVKSALDKALAAI